MDFRCTAAEMAAIEERAAELSFAAHGGTITATAAPGNAGLIDARIVVPHAALDAFGCYNLVGCLRQPEAQEPSGMRVLRHRGVEIVQVWRPSVAKRSVPLAPDSLKRTLTQRFIAELLNRLPELATIGIAVALDDLGALDAASFWGNSMWFLFYARAQAAQLAASASSVEWGEELRTTATRALRIAERRGRDLPRADGADNALVVSAMGRFDRFEWFPRLSPDRFVGAPTPASPNGANVFIWSTDRHDVLVLTAREGHPLLASTGLMSDALHTAMGGN